MLTVLSCSNFSPSQVGTAPNLIAIDGGKSARLTPSGQKLTLSLAGVDQTNMTGFNFNGESDLDLQYAFGLTNPQPILLLQTGDLVEGASFNNWLDAVDGSFCTFEGGDDPTQVRDLFSMEIDSSFIRLPRMVSTPIRFPEALMVGSGNRSKIHSISQGRYRARILRNPCSTLRRVHLIRSR